MQIRIPGGVFLATREKDGVQPIQNRDREITGLNATLGSSATVVRRVR